MKFKAEIDVMPLKSLLDPQGKAVSANTELVTVDCDEDKKKGLLDKCPCSKTETKEGSCGAADGKAKSNWCQYSYR